MKKKPIFRRMLVPMLGLVIIEILILVGMILGQGLLQELNANEEAVTNGKVNARKNYLESIMINNWMNVSSTVDYMNTVTQKMCMAETISVDTLDDNSEMCAELLTSAAPQLIEMMRSKHVTGAYIILNTEDLAPSMENGNYPDKPGIYLRDPNPTSLVSEQNEDLLIERSPVLAVRELEIATDSSWKSRFEFSGEDCIYYDSLYYPFQMAYDNGSEYEWKDMGYWGASRQSEEDGNTALTYSVPLMLDDGTVYGVLGIALTKEYIQSLLPYTELDEGGSSIYFLAQYSEENGEFCNVFGNGCPESLIQTETQKFLVDTDHYYTYMEPLEIYNSNTPFASQRWGLVGAVSYESMQSFQRELGLTLFVAIIVTLVVCIVGCLIVSYMMQRPIVRLAQEMRGKDSRKRVKLQRTGILEVDQIAKAMEDLSRDVIESGSKFSKIIEMASVRLAGFQIDRKNGTLFLTEHFFSIFGHSDIDEREMSVEEFKTRMKQLERYYLEYDGSVNGHIFQVPLKGKQCYIRVRISDDGTCCYGLAEDVTQTLLEKRILRHERDHDSLTNLYNRRAFRRKIQDLFDTQENQIGIGAFLMIDLDNLKYINDTYGHEYGDRYILQAALALDHCLRGNVCYARISGDEFNVFIYGCDSREEIEEQIQQLKVAMNSGHIELPDGKEQEIHATGGVAWYPEDSRSFNELSKYADYAMYTVKRKCKGEFQNFDMKQFQGQSTMHVNSAALTRMLSNRMMYYAFQPIVDARTGKIFAYEALLRSDVPELRSVKDVLETADRDGKLNQIEELTWFLALETFQAHIQNGRIAPDCYLFINSIPNQKLDREKELEFQQSYQKYMNQLVMELTEEERLDWECWEEKQNWHRSLGGKIALDDYGTGYNSEKTLLSVSPDFIKVDIAIVKDIHLDPDKRTIMAYIVNYAHERGKRIIAEGVETKEEAEVIIALGADYMQGYFFARPEKIPPDISEEGKKVLFGHGKDGIS